MQMMAMMVLHQAMSGIGLMGEEEELAVDDSSVDSDPHSEDLIVRLMGTCHPSRYMGYSIIFPIGVYCCDVCCACIDTVLISL